MHRKDAGTATCDNYRVFTVKGLCHCCAARAAAPGPRYTPPSRSGQQRRPPATPPPRVLTAARTPRTPMRPPRAPRRAESLRAWRRQCHRRCTTPGLHAADLTAATRIRMRRCPTPPPGSTTRTTGTRSGGTLRSRSTTPSPRTCRPAWHSRRSRAVGRTKRWRRRRRKGTQAPLPRIGAAPAPRSPCRAKHVRQPSLSRSRNGEGSAMAHQKAAPAMAPPVSAERATKSNTRL